MISLIEEMRRCFLNPPQFADKHVRFTGRVQQIRKAGKSLTFLNLVTPAGCIQCVIDSPAMAVPQKGSVIVADGIFRSNKIVKSGILGYELGLAGIEVLTEPDETPPSIDSTTARVLRLQNRHLDLRNPRVTAIFRVKSAVLKAIRDFLTTQRFVEVSSPSIVGESVEGPVEAFPVDYFGRKAYLSLSNMLYHMAVLGGNLDRVYEIGSCFRATKSHTSIHLSEFTVLDITSAYADRDDMIRMINLMINCILDEVSGSCADELALLEVSFDDLRNFEVITYSDLVSYLNSGGVDLEWGSTSTVPKNALLAIRKRFGSFFWIIDQAAESKAFYSRARDVGGRLTCFDFQLWHPRVTDIADGAERVTDLTELLTRMQLRGLDPGNFPLYINAVRHALPPMSGVGIGIERLIQLILGLPHIRETILFPRDARSDLL